jgi:GNAT superfamily N-acetyltransferase
MRIEKAKKEDSELLVYFIKELAKVEEFPFEVTVTSEDIQENLLSSNASAEAIICYKNDRPCGFAVYYYTFSTTTGKRGLHLDDLFIEPEYQGKGFGKQVLVYLSKLANKNRCARFEWWALKTNISAIKFYESLGAQQLEELSIFRLDMEKAK